MQKYCTVETIIELYYAFDLINKKDGKWYDNNYFLIVNKELWSCNETNICLRLADNESNCS